MMTPPAFQSKHFTAILVVLTWALAAGRMEASNLLTVTPATLTLSCNTISGPGAPVTILVKPAATLTKETIAVTMGTITGGLAITAPAAQTLSAANQAMGLTYTVNLAAGCVGGSTGSTTLTFNAAGKADAAATVTTTVTAAASGLVTAPVSLTVTCIKGSTYTPGPAQIVNVSSTATGGTPFSVDAASNPAWISVTPAAGGIATGSGTPITFTAVSPCGSFAAGSSNSALVHLRNLPAPDALIPVTLLVVSPSPLTAAPASASLSYSKGSGLPAFADIGFTTANTQPAQFTVDAASLPGWLSTGLSSGSAPKTLRFTTTNVVESLAPGVYTASVHVQVQGSADLVLPFVLNLASAQPKLSIAEGTTRNINWTVGQPLPLAIMTLVSSDASIPYSIATSGPLAPIVSGGMAKGVATSSGTPVLFTFDPAAFLAPQIGASFTGTATVTWGTPASATVINFRITVMAAGANVGTLSPANLPTATSGQTFTVALNGTGFVPGADATQRTVAGIVSGGVIVPSPNIIATVVNASNIILSITVPAAADPLLPFSPTGTGGTITFGVCNPMGASCKNPTSTAILTIGPFPVIQAVTSSSSFIEVTAPAIPTIAPFDMITLFGINFCMAGGKGCGTDTLYGAPDPATYRYPSALTPDAPGAAQRMLTVTFQTHATPPVAIATAPLLFATNSQINVLVPSDLANSIGKTIDIVVNFGTAANGTPRSSAPFPVNIAAANPGIFALGGDGLGDGAFLGSDWSVIGPGNEAAMRQSAADSDVIQMYVTGLGMPDSSSDNATAGKSLWPNDCVSTTSFLTSLNRFTAASATAIDGALILASQLNTGRLAPCFKAATNTPTVTIGGQPATVIYAGWSPDLVAGQYQLNVRMPSFSKGPFTSASGDIIAAPLTAAVQLPVAVSAKGRSSQAGVTVWVAPRLKIAGLAAAALTGVAGTAKSNQIVASGGTPPYQYALASGNLPAGLTLNPATGAISGTLAAGSAGSYPVTITATDSAVLPLSGSTAFTLTVTSTPNPPAK